MRVCFLVVGLHAWGKMSGSGSATRRLAVELIRRGIEVVAVTPRRKGQKPIEDLDGIKVYSFPRFSPLELMKIYRAVDADIFHSQDASLGTYLAMKAQPDRKHVVTCLSIRGLRDWAILLKSDLTDGHLRGFGAFLWENTPFASLAVRRSDAVFCPARQLIPMARRRYGLKHEPRFLSYPIEIPGRGIQKSEKPTVCFVGRWIPVKRPELFFELASRFPHVSFVATGRAENEDRDARLRQRYGSVPNLELPGFVSPERLREILEKSWILINTSLREDLPVPFVEAAAFQCAILSSVNPDGFAGEFGFWAGKDDFAEGLEFLLRDDEWRRRGNRAYDRVKNENEVSTVVNKHIQVYTELLRGTP
jgi:glycosyltransferase involved in cell wall biosynthesis